MYVIKTIKSDKEAEEFLNMMTEQGYVQFRQSEMKRINDVNSHTFFFCEAYKLQPWEEDHLNDITMSKKEAEEKLGIDLDDPIPDEFKG